MSNNNTPDNKMAAEAPREYPVDFTPKDREDLENFIKNGSPGLIHVKEEKLKEAAELYFNGAGYREISGRTGIKKVHILYFSYKYKWYDHKIEFYSALIQAVKEKTEIAFLKSFDFISEVMESIERFYRDKIDVYRISRRADVFENINLEKLKIYMKCAEHIYKFKFQEKNNQQGGPNAVLNVNLPGNSTIKKIDNNTLEISEKGPDNAEKISEMLAALAEIKKLNKK